MTKELIYNHDELSELGDKEYQRRLIEYMLEKNLLDDFILWLQKQYNPNN